MRLFALGIELDNGCIDFLSQFLHLNNRKNGVSTWKICWKSYINVVCDRNAKNIVLKYNGIQLNI